MKKFFGLFYGMVYGVSLVIPGLSGGTFLVIFGCYDTVCEAFALNFKVIKKHLLFLLLFGTGAIGGIIGFAHAITFLLAKFGIQTSLFFMGLILGGIPLIKKIAFEEHKFKPVCIVPFILGLGLVTSLFFIERFGVFGTGEVDAAGFMFFVRIMLYSFVAAIAMVMPGISGAFMLVAFGVYDIFMEALKGLDFVALLPAAIGVALGIFAGAKLVLFLIKKFKLIVYCVIMGMVIGSMVPLFPGGFGLNTATLAGIGCLVLGGGITLMLAKAD